ncbi:hypothetical protein [Natrinema altunense]|uniref:Uncharacterized protein n=1 Tax=Natrinema altunense TaxID=222984 RepID=A0A482Y5C8_9EURY|nr:hypothetical protein [Natrinema altunense]RZH68996.1 hypothetical protein ELS17_05960 [Natrinema altunense]
MTTDTDPTRVRLAELLEDLRTLEDTVPDALTLEPAIRNCEMTLEAYERLGGDGSETRRGDR